MSIESAIQRIKQILATRFGVVPDASNAGLSSSLLQALEVSLNVPLHRDHRALLELLDGEHHGGEVLLLGGRSWLYSSTEIVAQHRQLCELARRSDRLDKLDLTRIRSIGAVKPCYWNSRWIPFMDFDGPWVVDMDPPQGGTAGQVVSVSWEESEVRVEFQSLTSMLDAYAGVLAQGERRFRAARAS